MNKLIYIFLAFFIFAADQLSKWAVIQYMIKPELGGDAALATPFFTWLTSAGGKLPYTSIEIWPFFNIVMVWNEGVSFGLLNNGGEFGVLFLMVLSILIVTFFLVWLFKTPSRFQCICIALVIGGAIGNVIDRARFGAVVDFLDFHAFGWHYPAFNISDSCIVIGVFLLILQSFFFETPKKNAT